TARTGGRKRYRWRPDADRDRSEASPARAALYQGALAGVGCRGPNVGRVLIILGLVVGCHPRRGAHRLRRRLGLSRTSACRPVSGATCGSSSRRPSDADRRRMPDVSVVIPTRGRRDLLEIAIASVRADDSARVELIVVEDGTEVVDRPLVGDGRLIRLEHVG